MPIDFNQDMNAYCNYDVQVTIQKIMYHIASKELVYQGPLVKKDSGSSAKRNECTQQTKQGARSRMASLHLLPTAVVQQYLKTSKLKPPAQENPQGPLPEQQDLPNYKEGTKRLAEFIQANNVRLIDDIDSIIRI